MMSFYLSGQRILITGTPTHKTKALQTELASKFSSALTQYLM